MEITLCGAGADIPPEIATCSAVSPPSKLFKKRMIR